MASFFLNNRLSKLTNTTIRIRQLSSFNNRTKAGIASFIYEDDRNLWSESNWSQFGKQFAKTIQFPLPGQIGLGFCNKAEKFENLSLAYTNKKSITKQDQDQIDSNLKQFDCIYNPLPTDKQLNALMQAHFYQNQLDNQKNEENLQNIYKNLELKVYKCPTSLLQDFQNCIPTTRTELTLITVCLKTENDMSLYNDDVENERELLMDKFVQIAQDVCTKIKRNGFWADFIDPSSGKPYSGPYTHATFYEIDERYRKLGFEIVDYGCCKVISHHIWGTKAFVGSILTSAPKDSKCVQSVLVNAN